MQAILNMLGGGGGCVKQTTRSKYLKRDSPPYPANECCDMTLKGNDGLMYKSTPNKNGVCTWKPLHKKGKKMSGGASKKKSKSKSKSKSRRVRSRRV